MLPGTAFRFWRRLGPRFWGTVLERSFSGESPPACGVGGSWMFSRRAPRVALLRKNWKEDIVVHFAAVAAFTTLTLLQRECPVCAHTQIAPASRMREAVMCEQCDYRIPPSKKVGDRYPVAKTLRG